MIREMAAALVVLAPGVPPPPVAALPPVAAPPPLAEPHCIHLTAGRLAEAQICALFTIDGVIIAGDARVLRAQGTAVAELSHTHKRLEYGGTLS